jgi:hypothetical protein
VAKRAASSPDVGDSKDGAAGSIAPVEAVAVLLVVLVDGSVRAVESI